MHPASANRARQALLNTGFNHAKLKRSGAFRRDDSLDRNDALDRNDPLDRKEIERRQSSRPGLPAIGGDEAGSSDQPSHCLRPGRNVWRLSSAERAAVLIDAADYFTVLREAMLAARHTIYIAGWDVDSRTPLLPPDINPPDGLPTQLGPFLAALAGRRPELSVKILLWNYAVIYASERESMPALSLRWNTPPQVDLCLDDSVPLASSHHQKIVVIDDQIAFCGGLDLTIRRWDTSAHLPKDDRRIDPYGKPYTPFHDVQLAVDGQAARDLGDLVRQRWRRAAGEELPPPPAQTEASADADADTDTGATPWPVRLKPDLQQVTLGIARTMPAFMEMPETREIEMLFRDMTAVAQRHLYVESQYVTFTGFAECLAEAMRARPDLEAVIVTPREYAGWVENMAMLEGRQHFVNVLREAGVMDRVALRHPHITEDGTSVDVKIHSKVMIVDDRYLRIGSANLCNRSMGSDSECDLVLVGETTEQRAAIRRIRDRLMGEHCGVETAEMSEAVEQSGSILAAIARFHDPHHLRPIEHPAGEVPSWISAAAIADPPRPIDPLQLLQATPLAEAGKMAADAGGIAAENKERPDQAAEVATDLAGNLAADLQVPSLHVDEPGQEAGKDEAAEDLAAATRRRHRYRLQRRGIVTLATLMVLTAVMALAWTYTPLSSLADAVTDPARLRPWLAAHDQGGNSILALLTVVAIFIIAGFIAFPVVVLIAATAVAFGAWPGALYAILGALISAVSTYGLGWWLGPDLLRHTFGPRLNRINQTMQHRGILTVTIARMMPVAPFTVVNLAAGGLRIPPLDFVIGTILGLAPGVIVMSVLGSRIISLVRDPTLLNVTILVVLFLGSILLAILLQKLAARLRVYFG